MEAILPQVAQGNELAIEQCLDRYGPLVWALARRFFPTMADAEDAVQEVFIEIWQNASRFREDLASEKTFVVMIARRRLIDRRRKLARSPEVATMEAESLESTDASPAVSMETSEEATRAADCLDKLRPEVKQVLELSIYDGLSQTSIADQVSLPLGTVKTHARRGLSQMRDCMQMQRPLATEGRVS